MPLRHPRSPVSTGGRPHDNLPALVPGRIVSLSSLNPSRRLRTRRPQSLERRPGRVPPGFAPPVEGDHPRAESACREAALQPIPGETESAQPEQQAAVTGPQKSLSAEEFTSLRRQAGVAEAGVAHHAPEAQQACVEILVGGLEPIVAGGQDSGEGGTGAGAACPVSLDGLAEGCAGGGGHAAVRPEQLLRGAEARGGKLSRQLAGPPRGAPAYPPLSPATLCTPARPAADDLRSIAEALGSVVRDAHGLRHLDLGENDLAPEIAEAVVAGLRDIVPANGTARKTERHLLNELFLDRNPRLPSSLFADKATQHAVREQLDLLTLDSVPEGCLKKMRRCTGRPNYVANGPLRRVKCNAGHLCMLLGDLPGAYAASGWRCKKCDKVGQRDKRWFCQQCRYDLCRNCADARRGARRQPAPAPAAGGGTEAE